jgi:hypothetical protein
MGFYAYQGMEGIAAEDFPETRACMGAGKGMLSAMCAYSVNDGFGLEIQIL